MKIFLALILTILILPYNSLATTESLEVSCTEYPSVQIEMNPYVLRIQSSDLEFEIPLEEDLFAVFMKKYKGDRDLYSYFRVPSRNSDANYSYDLTIMDTDQPENKSLKVVIESLQKTKAQNWYNKYLGKWFDYESLPYKKYEVYVTLRKTGRPSQILMRSFEIAFDHSELVETSDVTCLATVR